MLLRTNTCAQLRVMVPLQHGHTPVFTSTTGPEWISTVVLGCTIVAAGYALLQPFMPRLGRKARLATAIAAGTASLLSLVAAERLEVPHQVVGLAAMSLCVPVVAVAQGPAARSGPGRVMIHVVAPLIVACWTGVGALMVIWAATGNPDPGPLLSSALFAGGVGLAWLVLCEPRLPTARAALHLTAWLLGLLTLAAVSVPATTADPADTAAPPKSVFQR